MGMFDNVKFDHPMPDGFGGGNFHCKDLRHGMDMATYEVGADGRLRRIASDEGQPLGDLNYSHHLVITGDGHPHSYTLVFKAGTLCEIRCFQTGVAVPFVAVDGGTN
ncbi:hypothetical protein QRD43_20620 [Pelomonas sp. APW6]|uniref:Uncharacterized protein n=1 Tax=Roseateles subflavus TaxID=3053353 RepID=A0ABT7LN69_9BURK|nr:hypothetical protein [Pelomonas sp. APW6]MDL5034318.1 hypothetical protein [Pelomonas sp. APW6]